ncbi:MAG TPA: hypothetical protein VI583_13845 [Cyclobacteriaceae bacterium]|nr:hypothetical protein [Cyclobacteriaceae bacterium]
MKTPDEEIRKMIDREELARDAEVHEVKAYQHVFRALSTEQGFELPEDFADKVVNKARAREKSQAFPEIALMLIGQVGITFILIVAIIMAGLIFDSGMIRAFMNHIEIIVGGAVIFILVNFLERKFIRFLY